MRQAKVCIFTLHHKDKNKRDRSKSLLTSMAFLEVEECGSWLHLELRQRLVQLNRFAIVDQIQASYEVRSLLQSLFLQFPDCIRAPQIHKELHAIRAIEDTHRNVLRTWWNWLLNLENGVGSVFQWLMEGNRYSVFGVSFDVLLGSTCFSLRLKVLSLKENQTTTLVGQLITIKLNIRLDKSGTYDTLKLLKISYKIYIMLMIVCFKMHLK